MTESHFTDVSMLIEELQRCCERSPNWRDLPTWQRVALRGMWDGLAKLLCGDPTNAHPAREIGRYAKIIEDRLTKDSEQGEVNKFR